jgi:hypothetical protein
MARSGQQDSTTEAGESTAQDPELRRVVWTAEDVVGLFVDAARRGDLSEGKLVGYFPLNPGELPLALFRQTATGQTVVYEMDLQTRKPVRVTVFRLLS